MGPLGIVSSRLIGESAFELPDSDETKRERAFSELVLPEMLASCMGLPQQRPSLQFSLLALSPSLSERGEAGAAETWRPHAGGLTGTLNARVRDVGSGGVPGGDADDPGRLITQIEAGELGKIRLVVERTARGLRVLLGVDNPETAASAETQRALLEQSLRASGLTVVSVTISRVGGDGTDLSITQY